MIRASHPRSGALLPAVLAVMVTIGLAASAGLFLSRQERATGRGAELETAATAAADEAQVIALERLSSRALGLSPGESLVERVPLAGRGVEAWARLTRLGETQFALMIEARASHPRGTVARRRVSFVLRLDPPTFGTPAALSLDPGGTAPATVADGADHAPDDWPCSLERSDAPAIVHPFASATDSATLTDFRDRATVRLSGGAFVPTPAPMTQNGECVMRDAGNWGDPTRSGPCGSYFPIVHASGDLSIVGGTGQGVLVVDGDLAVSGGFEFVGSVIVAGDLAIGPGGTLLTGGVRAASVVDAGGVKEGDASIRRSSCGLRTALLATAALLPVRDRPWAAER